MDDFTISPAVTFLTNQSVQSYNVTIFSDTIVEDTEYINITFGHTGIASVDPSMSYAVLCITDQNRKLFVKVVMTNVFCKGDKL